MTELNEKNTLKILFDVGKSILLESNGDPAKIMALGVALTIASVAIGYTVHTVRHIVSKPFRTEDETIVNSKNQTL